MTDNEKLPQVTRPYKFEDFCLGYNIGYYQGFIINELLEMSHYSHIDVDDLSGIEYAIGNFEEHVKTLADARYRWPTPACEFEQDLYSAMDQTGNKNYSLMWCLKNIAVALLQTDFKNVHRDFGYIKAKVESEASKTVEQCKHILKAVHETAWDSKHEAEQTLFLEREVFRDNLDETYKNGFNPAFVREVTEQTPEHEKEFFNPGSTGEYNIGLLFLATALCGEAGELANVIKKIIRQAPGDVENNDLEQAAIVELADVMNYCLLMARKLGVDPANNAQLANTMRNKNKAYLTKMWGKKRYDNLVALRTKEGLDIGTDIEAPNANGEEKFTIVTKPYFDRTYSSTFVNVINSKGFVLRKNVNEIDPIGSKYKVLLGYLRTYFKKGTEFILDGCECYVYSEAQMLAGKPYVGVEFKSGPSVRAHVPYNDLVDTRYLKMRKRKKPLFAIGKVVNVNNDITLSYHLIADRFMFQGEVNYFVHGLDEKVQHDSDLIYDVASNFINSSEHRRLEYACKGFPVGTEVTVTNEYSEELTTTSLPYMTSDYVIKFNIAGEHISLLDVNKKGEANEKN